MKSVSPGARGCGDARPGCYLLGGMAPGGMLAPATLCAGTMVHDDDWNLRFSVEPQIMHWFDPERTVDTRKLWYLDTSQHDRQRGDYTGSTQQQISNLGSYGLIHHVGESHYSPVSHLLETSTRGPSLRIDPRIAAQISMYLPLRMFFVFPKLLYFESTSYLEAALAEMREMEPFLTGEALSQARALRIPVEDAWADETSYDWDKSREFEPTWGFTDWGGTIYDDNGLNHDYLKLAAWIERRDLSPRKADEKPGIFYYSWVTKAVQYVAEDEVKKKLGVSELTAEVLEQADQKDFLDSRIARQVEEGTANVEAVVLKPRGKGEAGYDYPFK